MVAAIQSARSRWAFVLSWAVFAGGCTASATMQVAEPVKQPDRLTAEASAPGGKGAAPSGERFSKYQERVPSEPIEEGDAASPPQGAGGWKAERSSLPNEGQQATVVVVREGDTLYSIAKRHAVTVQMLYAANGLLNDRLTPGQHIVIPRSR